MPKSPAPVREMGLAAEGVGFEPTVDRTADNGFRVRAAERHLDARSLPPPRASVSATARRTSVRDGHRAPWHTKRRLPVRLSEARARHAFANDGGSIRIRRESGAAKTPRIKGAAARRPASCIAGGSDSSNSQVSGPSSEEPETAPFVKEQQSCAARLLVVHGGSAAGFERRRCLCLGPAAAPRSGCRHDAGREAHSLARASLMPRSLAQTDGEPRA
jgi:hypothetical protein